MCKLFKIYASAFQRLLEAFKSLFLQTKFSEIVFGQSLFPLKCAPLELICKLEDYRTGFRFNTGKRQLVNELGPLKDERPGPDQARNDNLQETSAVILGTPR